MSEEDLQSQIIERARKLKFRNVHNNTGPGERGKDPNRYERR